MTFLRIAALAALVVPCPSAQVLYELDSGAARLSATYMPSPMVPAGASAPPAGIFLAPAAQPCGSLIPPPALSGAVTIDESPPARVLFTDGATLYIEPHPLYPAPGVTTCMGGLASSMPGPSITAMAIDPATDRLYLTDGFNLASINFPPTGVPPTAPVALPFVVATGLELTGMDFDKSTGRLWATDSAGNVYNFSTGGTPAGPQPVVPATVTGVTFTGLAIDDSSFAGAFPPPACSTQTAGFGIVLSGFDAVLGTSVVYDALVQTMSFPATPSAAAPLGATLVSDAQLRNGMSSGPSSVPVINMVSPYTAPNLAGGGVTVSGTPGVFVYTLADLGCATPAPGLGIGGFQFHLGPATYILFDQRAMPAAGAFTLPTAPPPGVVVPPGTAIALQAVDVLGRFSDALQLRLSL